MGKTYFESKKGSVEDKINTIEKEQSTISASYKPDVKLSVEKKYFESKKGSIEDIASKIVSEGLDKVNPDAVKKSLMIEKTKIQITMAILIQQIGIYIKEERLYLKQ